MQWDANVQLDAGRGGADAECALKALNAILEQDRSDSAFDQRCVIEGADEGKALAVVLDGDVERVARTCYGEARARRVPVARRVAERLLNHPRDLQRGGRAEHDGRIDVRFDAKSPDALEAPSQLGDDDRGCEDRSEGPR